MLEPCLKSVDGSGCESEDVGVQGGRGILG